MTRTPAALAAALTILLSATLLFAIQPVVAKAILPWFGGTPAVWTTCMLFFQALLLGGYAYAHALIRFATPAWQFRIHAALLAVSLLQLPVHADAALVGATSEAPIPQILRVLASAVALPYFALSSTGPLLQAWSGRAGAGSPYRLYALSNAGSLAALLGYPFGIEPLSTLGEQFTGWSVGYLAFALACASVAYRATRHGAPALASAGTAAPAAGRVALWIALPAAASVLLLAITSQICQEIAVVPLLWLLPLTLYLLSFILCFDGERWYRRGLMLGLLALLATCALLAFFFVPALSPRVGIPLYSGALLAACMVCHGELYALRPPAARLTQFYLMVSIGGALGGVLVAIVAPLVFARLYELPLGIVAVLALPPFAAAVRARESATPRPRRWLAWELGAALLAAGCVFLMSVPTPAHVVARNFYGVLRVQDSVDRFGAAYRRFAHGVTTHGIQYLAPERRDEPTAYYGPQSGGGRVLANFRADGPRRIAALGLGAGTIASYARPGDLLRFYEINPLVVRLAREQFTFLADARGRTEVVTADARLALERDADAVPFDVIVADAFSGDAVPAHLLTREAFQLYARRLKPGGVIAVNITNRGLDLRPVVLAAARSVGWDAVLIASAADERHGCAAASWMVASDDRAFLHGALFADASPLDAVSPILWRDDYSNLFRILK